MANKWGDIQDAFLESTSAGKEYKQQRDKDKKKERFKKLKKWFGMDKKDDR